MTSRLAALVMALLMTVCYAEAQDAAGTDGTAAGDTEAAIDTGSDEAAPDMGDGAAEEPSGTEETTGPALDDPSGPSGDEGTGTNVDGDDVEGAHSDDPGDLSEAPGDGETSGSEASDEDALRPNRFGTGTIEGQLRSLRARYRRGEKVDRDALRERAEGILSDAEAVLGPDATREEIREFFYARSSGYETAEDMRADVANVVGEDAGWGLVKAYLNLRQAAGLEGGVDGADYDRIRELVAEMGDQVTPGQLKIAWREATDDHPGRGKGRMKHRGDGDIEDTAGIDDVDEVDDLDDDDEVDDVDGLSAPQADGSLETEALRSSAGRVEPDVSDAGLQDAARDAAAERIEKVKERLLEVEAKTGVDVRADGVLPADGERPEPKNARPDDREDKRNRGSRRRSDG